MPCMKQASALCMAHLAVQDCPGILCGLVLRYLGKRDLFPQRLTIQPCIMDMAGLHCVQRITTLGP